MEVVAVMEESDGLWEQWLEAPLHQVSKLLAAPLSEGAGTGESTGAGGGGKGQPPLESEALEAPAAQLLALLEERPARWESVPLVGVAEPATQAGRLVRYRGMVQDMLEPEYYMAVYELHKPLPSQPKRICMKYCEDPRQHLGTARNDEATNIKTAEQEESEEEEGHFLPHLIFQRERLHCVPRPAQSQWATPSSSLSGCILKLYDKAEGSLKLNELVECVGILAPIDDGAESQFYQEQAAEASSSAPSDNNDCQLRLHCLAYRKLLPSDFIPAELRESPASTLVSVRQSLVECIAATLGEDALAAEYVLLGMLSHIYTRYDTLPLGSLCLNLCGLPEYRQHSRTTRTSTFTHVSSALNNIGSAIHSLSTSLLPASMLIPMTLQNLNSGRFTPFKDYNTNRLVSGALQLAAGTFLILDETCLEEGTLNKTGVHNVSALKELIQWQKVSYDFQYYRTQFECDIPVLTLSRSSKPLLPFQCQVPLRPTTPFGMERKEQQIEDQALLARCRAYLACMRNINVTIDADVSKLVEDDFVNRRQRQEGGDISPELLHLWLTLARLQAMSFGEDVLTEERWNYTKALEQQRLSLMEQQQRIPL
ncbi:AAA domain-containing protein [Balamuthia mandrillaris]